MPPASSKDLASRLANPFNITDGYNVYLTAVEQAFGSDIDYECC